MARAVLLDREDLRPGDRAYVHFRLESPSAALPGDRYVIRSYSPAVTIGGGSILDPNPPKARRGRTKLIEHLRVLEQGRPMERVERHLLAAGFAPMTIEELRARCDLDRETVVESLRELVEKGQAIRVGAKEEAGALHVERVESLRKEVLARLAEFHAKEPLKDGLAKEEIRSRLPEQLPPSAFMWLLALLATAGQIAVERDKVRLAGHRPTLSAAEEEIKTRIAQVFQEAAFQPPAPEAALGALKVEAKLAHAVFRRLVDDGVLVKIGEGMFIHKDSHLALQDRVLEHFRSQPSINVAALKDLFGVSRKYAIPFLEYLDSIRITRRQGDERVPYT
jgi:selenocysteine-specific elongation factor